MQHVRLLSGVLANKPSSLHSEVLYPYRGKLLMVYYFVKGYLTWIPPLYSTNKLIIETTHVNICDCFEVPFIEIKLQIEKLIVATLN